MCPISNTRFSPLRLLQRLRFATGIYMSREKTAKTPASATLYCSVDAPPSLEVVAAAAAVVLNAETMVRCKLRSVAS